MKLYGVRSMKIVLYSDKIDEYLKDDDVIDYGNKAIEELADERPSDTELESMIYSGEISIVK